MNQVTVEFTHKLERDDHTFDLWVVGTGTIAQQDLEVGILHDYIEACNVKAWHDDEPFDLTYEENERLEEIAVEKCSEQIADFSGDD
jgi:hypothetical protein